MSWEPAGGGDGQWDSGAATAFNDNASTTNDFGGGLGNDGGDGGGFGGGSRGACFNCGEEGHNKADCPNPAVPREFTGACRLCETVGHRAADCPTAPPKVCNNCTQEGHLALECKNPRKIDRSHIADVPAEVAWNELIAAANDRDLDDIREAALKYLKVTPDVTYPQLENAFRSQKVDVFLIAMEKELALTYTNMDLQGNLDKKFSVSWRLSPHHQRPKEKDAWPTTPEENLVRLADAGEPVDRGIPKCSNCDNLGHTRKNCPEEKQEVADRAEVKCFNCEAIGHRVRDCPLPRPDKFTCRNCHKPGHSAKECPEPRSAEGVECKKCGETGHFARDCPTGGGGGPRTCRNCDAEDHIAKDCPKPKDWSRVQCQNCKEFGHTKVRCAKPLVEEDDGVVSGGGLGRDTNGDGFAAASGDGFAASSDDAGANSNGDGDGNDSTNDYGANSTSAPAGEDNWGASMGGAGSSW